MNNRPPLWLRDEPKRGERRAAITPSVAATLIDAGFQLTVERSGLRAFADADYAAAGARLAQSGGWRSAPLDALVIGLKELDVEFGPFERRHVHFAHAFKRQHGWEALLRAFGDGGGKLFDLEYLVDDEGRRVAAFGYWAGFVGAALGVLAQAHAQRGDSPEPLAGPLEPWPDRQALLDDVTRAVAGVRSCTQRGSDSGAATLGNAMVIGARGRSGQGAVDLLRAAGCIVTEWDIEQTRKGGPFDAVLTHDIVVNCVFVAEPVAPFATLETLARRQRRTAVIVDVSCDPFGDANVLPIYDRPTTLDTPVRRLASAKGDSPSLDLVAIDHLPSLLPGESSEDFAAQLLPTLLSLTDDDALTRGAWGRAASVFEDRLAAARSGASSDPDMHDIPSS